MGSQFSRKIFLTIKPTHVLLKFHDLKIHFFKIIIIKFNVIHFWQNWKPAWDENFLPRSRNKDRERVPKHPKKQKHTCGLPGTRFATPDTHVLELMSKTRRPEFHSLNKPPTASIRTRSASFSTERIPQISTAHFKMRPLPVKLQPSAEMFFRVGIPSSLTCA